MSKGGPRRALVAAVDMDQLHKCFEDAVDRLGAKAFDLGTYQKRSIAQACSAEGLHQNAEYVRRLVAISMQVN